MTNSLEQSLSSQSVFTTIADMWNPGSGQEKRQNHYYCTYITLFLSDLTFTSVLDSAS